MGLGQTGAHGTGSPGDPVLDGQGGHRQPGGKPAQFRRDRALVPPGNSNATDPNKTLEAYHEWHLLRRLGGMGLGQMSATEAWLGIQYMKAPERRAAFERLLQKGLVMTVEIENMPGKTFFMRRVDVSTLKRSRKLDQAEPQASFLPPLDNLLWDRKLVSMVFGFDYIWEAYKMPHQRNMGITPCPCYMATVLSRVLNRSSIERIEHWSSRIGGGRMEFVLEKKWVLRNWGCHPCLYALSPG